MKFADPADSPAVILEELTRVAVFLGESACGAREVEYGKSALCGMQSVFWALREDMEELRVTLIKPLE